MKREKDISFEELKEYADGIAKKNKDQIAKLVENAGINSVPDSGLNYGLTFDEGLKDCPNIQMMRLADLYSDLLMRAWDDVLRLVLNEMSAASGMSAGDNRKDTIRRFTDTIRINDDISFGEVQKFQAERQAAISDYIERLEKKYKISRPFCDLMVGAYLDETLRYRPNKQLYNMISWFNNHVADSWYNLFEKMHLERLKRVEIEAEKHGHSDYTVIRSNIDNN